MYLLLCISCYTHQTTIIQTNFTVMINVDNLADARVSWGMSLWASLWKIIFIALSLEDSPTMGSTMLWLASQTIKVAKGS